MNIFEGSRRIAKAIAGVIIAGFVITAAVDTPHVPFLYAYDENNALQSVDECRSSSDRFYPKIAGRPDAFAVVCGYGSGPEEIQVPDHELTRIDTLLTEKKLSDLGRKFSILGAILLGGWALTWGIGWIVRGFMGIPRRQDTKS